MKVIASDVVFLSGLPLSQEGRCRRVGKRKGPRPRGLTKARPLRGEVAWPRVASRATNLMTPFESYNLHQLIRSFCNNKISLKQKGFRKKRFRRILVSVSGAVGGRGRRGNQGWVGTGYLLLPQSHTDTSLITRRNNKALFAKLMVLNGGETDRWHVTKMPVFV